MEKIVLFATDLGLGTCWLGGTFRKSKFIKVIDKKENEILPAVLSIGYPAKKRRIMENLIRRSARGSWRREWDVLFYEGDFTKKLEQANAGNYATALKMVRAAPSASNKQPWRLVKEIGKDVFHFYLHRSKGYQNNLDKIGVSDMQRIDIGIAMCHFELTAREQGLNGNWEIMKQDIEDLPERTQYIISWKAE
jgi:nitroreductase